MEEFIAMKSFIWHIAEILTGVVVVVFVLVPSPMEDGFVRKLYENNPIFCVVLLAATGILTAVTFTHRAIETHRNKKAKKADAVSSKGMR
jgi:hypothetical protein